jgi:hypothetical protein
MFPRLTFAVLCWLCVSSAAAQEPILRRPEQLRREIAEVRANIAEQTLRLQLLEKELAALESPRDAIPPGLRFPVGIERAMLGEGNAGPQGWPLKQPRDLYLQPLQPPRLPRR